MSQFPSLAPDTPAVFWQKLREQTLGAAASAITFSGIAATFTFFRVSGWAQNDGGGTTLVRIRLNNDSGANYEHQLIDASAAVVTALRQVARNGMDLVRANLNTDGEMGFVATIAKPIAGEEAQGVFEVGHEQSAADPVLTLFGHQWNNTADLVNRIDLVNLSHNWVTNTRILLEGGKPA